jgi:hypothetical protein
MTAAVFAAVSALRAHAVTWFREHAEACLGLNVMSGKDAARWASARDMADLGGLVIAWLNGEVRQTPGHCGPPCGETLPLIPVLTLVNRAGFVTDASQLAETHEGRTWNTWVDGFACDTLLARLREAVSGTPLILTACRRGVHECERASHWCRCPWREVTGFWSGKCPAAADELRACWFVSIADPEPGRNDRLWPALEAALITAGGAA